VFSGDYVVGERDSPVAVLVIGRGRLSLPIGGYAIMGTVKTENLGLEKVLANVVSNPRIRFLIVVGREEFGHFPADAIIALDRNGVDEQRRIVGCRSAIPFLCNVPREVVERFRQQVEVIDLVHVKEVREIVAYDPEYVLDESSGNELATTIESCLAQDPGPFPAEAILIDSPSLAGKGATIAANLNRLSDDFVGQMLRMPSERLSTYADITVIDDRLGIILDPVDGTVRVVPSAELAVRLQKYLRGMQ
jgi:tetrahydromethanopterin S-methyltransferase subunit A